MAKPQPPFPDDDLTTTIELLDIATLRPHPRNDRIHPPDEIAHLRQSIREHGIYRNVVIANDGTILAGRGVVQAAKEEGRTQIPGQRRPYGPDDPRALKLLVGDNHIADQSRQDDALLAALLQAIAAEDPLALLGTGFDEAMLTVLVEGQKVPDFAPGGIADQGRLDQKQPMQCPACGHEWVPRIQSPPSNWTGVVMRQQSMRWSIGIILAYALLENRSGSGRGKTIS